MNWSDLTGRPRSKPQERIAYGELAQQFADLWLPPGPGAPLVLMVHGGCWTKSIASLSLMDHAAEDLRARGIAVLNVEYRGLDEPGGGYPGTYEDIASAVEAAPGIAAVHGLSFDRPVIVGHSAGGHLALWAAARPRLPRASPLWRPAPVRFCGVVDLAGLPDLERNLETACGPDAPRTMAGPATPARPNPYLDTSPAALLPLGLAQVVLHGTEDRTVPAEIGAAYADQARALGDEVRFLTPPGGHVEEIAPGAAAWEAAVVEILGLLTR